MAFSFPAAMAKRWRRPSTSLLHARLHASAQLLELQTRARQLLLELGVQLARQRRERRAIAMHARARM